MKSNSLLVFLGLALVSTILLFSSPVHSISGLPCTGCVIALDVIEQKAINFTVAFLQKECANFPSPLGDLCTEVVNVFGPTIVNMLQQKISPDKICQALKLCSTCELLPNMPTHLLTTEDRDKHRKQVQARLLEGVFKFQLFEIPKRARNNNGNPDDPTIDDFDGDLYTSQHSAGRGADWRGKDCNDLDASIRPGIFETSIVDDNCNGIYGMNWQTGKLYEDELCDKDSVRSFVAFGDSASAGFSIPVDILELKNFSLINHCLTDEFDSPNIAWGSGWDISSIHHSVYIQLRENNLCNHRDYQNLAKNGAEMKDLAGYQVNAMSNVQKPVFALVGYIGNDVCKDTLAEMTQPSDFHNQLIAGLNALDAKLPAGSYVQLLGLVDGRILWNTMHNLTHPIGVTYAEFYAFLSCTGANPCTTWLNGNETIRDLTSQRALELDAVILSVVNQSQANPGMFKNIKLAYKDFGDILDEGFKILAEQHLPASDLIEPVDGFHPSLALGHHILSQIIFQYLQNSHPDFIGGPPNPFNSEIKSRFGDQGGF